MLVVDSYDSSTSDLNLIVPRGIFLKMTTYLQQEGAYIKTEKEESPHSIRPLPSTVTVQTVS
jgi:hypothetical protein